MGVVCVSLLIYIRTNTHAHTRTRGPAVGRAVGLEVEPRADNNDPAYPQTQIPSSGPHVKAWPWEETRMSATFIGFNPGG